MQNKVFHIVPDNRLGGIFIYIERLSLNSSRDHKHFIFKGQPDLNGVYKKGKKPINLRKYYSLLILIDLIINSPLYLLQILSNEKIFFHTPFLLIHHLFSLLLGKDSYLVLHDYNINKILQILLKRLKPKNVFCASQVLIDHFQLYDFVEVLPPFYSEFDLSNLLQTNIEDFNNKGNIIFLGNINKVKQISNFCISFNNFMKNNDLTLSIYGDIIHKEIYNQIVQLNSDSIFIYNSIPHDQVHDLLRGFKFLLIPSESEVFPIVYFEALNANLIPLVNDIPFFRMVSGDAENHIFQLNRSETIRRTLCWAKNLTFQDYLNYILNLKSNFASYYKGNSSNLKKLFGYN